MASLAGKSALVTGGSRGIGAAIVQRLANEGASVAFTYSSSTEQANSLVEQITNKGGNALAIKADAANQEAVRAAVQQAAKHFGKIDILVNNAGILRFGPLESVAPETWDQTIAVNVKGYLLCAQRFGERMLERRSGTVVNVASIAATEPHPYCGSYSVSKAAVVMLTQQLALEWGPSGVTVNAVSPGFIPTPLNTAFYAVPGVTEQRSKLVPLRSLGSTRDVANSVMFLASGFARYVNGHNLVVDGGWTVW